MLRPTLFELPLWGDRALAFPAYGTFLTLGFLAAFLVGRRRVRAIGLGGEELFNAGYAAVLAGVVGAHFLHVALNWRVYFGDSVLDGLWRTVAFWQGGLAYYGGLAAGLLALVLFARRKGVPALDLLDFVAPLGALGLALTRGGCFLNGCCYGRPSALPWAVSFPPGSLPQVAQVRAGMVSAEAPSLPVHPTQLYELIVASILFVLLWARFPRRRFRGEVVLLFFLLYAPWRLASELVRADSSPWRPWGFDLGPINVYQALSIAVFLVAAMLWTRLSGTRASVTEPASDPARKRP